MRPVILALMALAACAAPTAQGYRNPAVRISSSAAFEPARFEGQWQVVAGYGAEATCGVRPEVWTVDGSHGFVIRGNACAEGVLHGFATKAVMSGPGRLVRAAREGNEDLWVLWVDGDYRIAAIGTPDGRFGRIMARPGAARDDLIAAAREVLDFNGYDISRLQMLK